MSPDSKRAAQTGMLYAVAGERKVKQVHYCHLHDAGGNHLRVVQYCSIIQQHF